jgi:hypothetical protein
MLSSNVFDTFEIKGRGVVVATDKTYEQFPGDLKLKIGDRIELRMAGRVVFRTKIVGIEHFDPWSPRHLFALLLPSEASKADVPVGSEMRPLE